MHIFSSLWQFFSVNFPSVKLIVWLFPVSLVWSFSALFISGSCKKYRHWKTGYTRKLFHFFIFSSAFLYQQWFALPGVFVLGWAVTATLIYTCIQGEGYLLYEALAREKDAPHRTKYIVYSYLATFAGGVLANIFFGKLAVFGYAVTGIADALAEPVGTMFGKHHYRVWSIHPDKVSHRSIKGSVAVLVASFLVYWLICTTIFMEDIQLLRVAGIAVVCMLTEAISPSGFDNFLLQLVASGLAVYVAPAV